MIPGWEQCVTSSGVRYERLVQPEMPRVPAEYADSLAYLYATPEAAEQRSGDAGCGFLLGVEFEEIPNLAHVYLVTNAHVTDECRVARYNSNRGSKVR